LSVTGAAIGLAASQIYPLLYLTVATPIATELGHPELYIWMLTAGILAMGAIGPFVGPLTDLVGRKNIFLGGFTSGMIGSIMCGAAQGPPAFIAGQAFLGIGAVTTELIAIAVIAEVVPTAKRPIWAVFALSAIVPWAPGTLYANYILNVSWRWIALALGLWNLLGFVAVFVGYRPPPRVNSRGLSNMDMIKRIDFVGGGLIIAGLLLFLYGLNTGGIFYPWNTAHVLVPIILGPSLMVIAGLYEFFLAPYPLFPRRIIHDARPFFCMLAVIFAAGINFIPLVSFWPIETIAVFEADHSQVGIWCVPIGVCILGGAMISAVCLALFKNHVHHVMLGYCIVQTVGKPISPVLMVSLM
jgi:MFS family permease